MTHEQTDQTVPDAGVDCQGRPASFMFPMWLCCAEENWVDSGLTVCRMSPLSGWTTRTRALHQTTPASLAPSAARVFTLLRLRVCRSQTITARLYFASPLNSSSNSEYIRLVYDSAAVFNIGRFEMYGTGFFRRD